MKRSWEFQTATALLTVMSLEAIPSGASANEISDALRGLAPPAVVESACGTRIVGGTCTTQQEWPWQVALYLHAKNGRTFFTCGGSLIAPNWVLSAAHCFTAETSERAEDWTAADDIHELTPAAVPTEAKTSAVKRIIRHEGYDANSQSNDIALVELAEPLQAKTINLLTSPDPTLEADRETVVTGWGMTRGVDPQKDAQGHIIGFVDGITKQPVDPTKFQSPQLREAKLPLIDVSQCKSDYQNFRTSIDQRNLCAGLPEGGRDSCQGDSGGPMMAQTPDGEWRQIGVVSSGNGCGLVKFPGIYTRVSAFADWLKTNVAGAPSAPADPTPVAQAPSNAQVPDNPAGLTIAFDKGDDVNVGDTVAYVATAHKAGYLTIFDVAPDGKLTQIYPNGASLRSPTGAIKNSLLDPSRPVVVPNYRNPYVGFTVSISEPRGEGMMGAVLSDQPLSSVDTPSAPKTYDKAAALGLIDRIRRELTRDLQLKVDGAAHPPWSVAMRKYTVH